MDIYRNLYAKMFLAFIAFAINHIQPATLCFGKYVDLSRTCLRAFQLNYSDSLFDRENCATHLNRRSFNKDIEKWEKCKTLLWANHVIDLSHNRIHLLNYPIVITRSAERMIFSYNMLTSIRLNDVHFVHSKGALLLDHNRISDITLGNSKSFVGTLDLSWNLIRRVDWYAVKAAALNLSHNLITSVDLLLEHTVYANIQTRKRKIPLLPNLTLLKLNLSNNQIDYWNLSIKYTVHKLKILDLSYNHIKYIYKIAFKDCKLTEIYLSHNKIRHMPILNFNKPFNLRIISVAHNKITSLNQFHLSNLNDLESLDLSFNPLVSLNNSMVRLLSLRTLNLQHTLLPPKSITFLDMYHSKVFLRELYLHSKETSLQNLEFVDYRLLEKLHLHRPVISLADEIGVSVVGSGSALQHLEVSQAQLGDTFLHTVLMGKFDLMKYFYFEKSNVTIFDYLLHLSIPNVVELSLAHNKIDAIPVYVLKDLLALELLNLTGNPISAPCFIAMENFHLSFIHADHYERGLNHWIYHGHEAKSIEIEHICQKDKCYRPEILHLPLESRSSFLSNLTSICPSRLQRSRLYEQFSYDGNLSLSNDSMSEIFPQCILSYKIKGGDLPRSVQLAYFMPLLEELEIESTNAKALNVWDLYAVAHRITKLTLRNTSNLPVNTLENINYLKHLNVDGCSFKEDSIDVRHNKALLQIHITKTHLKNIPETLTHAEFLRSLVIKSSNLTQFDSRFVHGCGCLQLLDLAFNRLKKVSMTWGEQEFRSISNMNFSYNEIEIFKLEPTFQRKSLTIDLRNNPIRQMRSAFGSFTEDFPLYIIVDNSRSSLYARCTAQQKKTATHPRVARLGTTYESGSGTPTQIRRIRLYHDSCTWMDEF